ncbi:MAG: glycosyltransferase [Candidatus Buchananbacteria bacterium]
MKKILYLITQDEFGGAQYYLLILAKNLKDSYNITIAAGDQTTTNGLLNQAEQAGIKIKQLTKLKRQLNFGQDYQALQELISLVKTEQPDIIHLNSTKMGVLGVIAAKLANSQAKIIFTVHGFILNEPLNLGQKIFYWFAELISLTLTDQIICVSEFDRQSIINAKLCSASKLITIHNALDLSELKFLSREEARQELLNNPTNDQLIIGTVANFYSTKGLNYFIKALALLKNNLPQKFFAVIIGDGELRPKLEQQIKKLGLTENILLAGYLPKAWQYLKAFDIYVCSSVKEGLPYSILQAQAAGLPIISTNVGGIPEIITDGQNGLLVETKNPTKLAEKIKLLTKNKPWRDQLGVGVKPTAEKFSQQQLVDQTASLYN